MWNILWKSLSGSSCDLMEWLKYWTSVPSRHVKPLRPINGARSVDVCASARIKSWGKVCLLIKILPQIRASAELAYWEDRLYIISASPATTASPTFHLYSLQERQLLLKIAPLKRCRLFYAVMSFYFLTKPSQYFVSLFFFFPLPPLFPAGDPEHWFNLNLSRSPRKQRCVWWSTE